MVTDKQGRVVLGSNKFMILSKRLVRSKVGTHLGQVQDKVASGVGFSVKVGFRVRVRFRVRVKFGFDLGLCRFRVGVNFRIGA